MTNFVLKIIALITMTFDHIGYIIFDNFSYMNYIGRLAFPIFAFLISEGYSHTKDLKKYFLRLFIFALISQVPYMLFLHAIGSINFTFNILFTLILGLLSITVYDKLNNKYLGLLFVILSCVIAHFFYFDYGWFGIAIIFIFHIFKNKKSLMNLFFCIATFIYYFYRYIKTPTIEYIFIIMFCILSLIPINLYNGKKGKYKILTIYLLSSSFSFTIYFKLFYLIYITNYVIFLKIYKYYVILLSMFIYIVFSMFWPFLKGDLL